MTQSPIRVLHPITRLIIGGAQENTMFTAAQLDKSRFRVAVVSGPQTGSEGSLIEEVRELGVPLTILPELVREINPGKDLSAIWKLSRLMRNGRYTIVHTHSSKAGVLGRIAARLAGVPVIVHTVHGWSFHERMSPWRRRAYVAMEKLAAAFSDVMIVVAEGDIEKGLREGIGRREQYRLIRSAIPLDDFDPARVDRAAARRDLGLPPDVSVVGNVGRFSPQKNPLDWVRIAGILGRALPDTYFLLVGDGPLRAQVEMQLEIEGIAERTKLTGLRRDVPAMLAAMDVFLLTSLWEGLPRVIPQAMTMGLPVVANRADGTVEAIAHGKTGFLCDPGDLIDMAAYCVQLLHDRKLREKMGARGRERALQEFDIRHMVHQIESLYNELLDP
ncbi:MAG: glycosyltransferase family 4 protein [Chloroflexi bacterium]|nr:glycosyltransferase family 4 protein [Chloroflexota bacterium]